MKKRLLSLLVAVVLLTSLCTMASAEEETAMEFSDDLVTYIKAQEGFSATPYHDGSKWYIGYGFACNPTKYPHGMTEAEADAMLRERLQGYADEVNGFLMKNKAAVTQSQFDALCSMTYNLGASWLDKSNRLPSYLIRGVSNYTEREIANAFAAWCHVDGVPSETLLRRRLAETRMFLYGDYSGSAAGWSWLILDVNGGKIVVSDVAVFETGKPYGTLPEAAKEGVQLGGWRIESGKLLTPTDIVDGNHRAAAVWVVAPAAPSAGGGTLLRPVGFPDVSQGAWYAPYVTRLAAAGDLSGYPDGTFRPLNNVTWGEALKLILLSAGFSEQTARTGEHWAAGYYDYAKTHGYLEQSEPTSLDRAITRYEVADLTAAALELKPNSGAASPFSDTNRDSVLALYAAGIVTGSKDTAGSRVFKGIDNLSRAELCALMVRVLDYVDTHFVFVSGYRAPIDFSLKARPYDLADFGADAYGRMTYKGSAGVVSRGVDVSYYQGEIDWNKVAADGISFAMIRCGYRGYGSGATLNEDTRFREYVTGALAAGLEVGVYFYSQALNAAEAREEAEYTLNLIRGYDITYPVVFDWEQNFASTSRTLHPNWTAVTEASAAYCEAVAAAGYRPMTYFNKHQAYLQVDMSRLQAYDGWLALYEDTPDYIYDFQMWQYTDKGAVSGIVGNVDLNLCLVEY